MLILKRIMERCLKDLEFLNVYFDCLTFIETDNAFFINIDFKHVNTLIYVINILSDFDLKYKVNMFYKTAQDGTNNFKKIDYFQIRFFKSENKLLFTTELFMV